jgi:hypothetical protein
MAVTFKAKRMEFEAAMRGGKAVLTEVPKG